MKLTKIGIRHKKRIPTSQEGRNDLMKNSAKDMIKQFTEQEIGEAHTHTKRFSTSVGIILMQIITFHTHQIGR